MTPVINSSRVFALEDEPCFAQRFPVLHAKKVIGEGVFSCVFEGTTPETVLKLTVDEAYYRFILEHGHGNGIPRLIKDWGSVDNEVHGALYLVEIQKLIALKRWDHDDLILERDAVIGFVGYKVAMNEQIMQPVSCQHGHARALDEVREADMFSPSVSHAMTAIAAFLRSSDLDLLLDLSNPENYMTDGKQLFITDPLLLVM